MRPDWTQQNLFETLGSIQTGIGLIIFAGMAVLFLLAIRYRFVPRLGAKFTGCLLILSALSLAVGEFWFYGGLTQFHQVMGTYDSAVSQKHFDAMQNATNSGKMFYAFISSVGFVLSLLAALLCKFGSVGKMKVD